MTSTMIVWVLAQLQMFSDPEKPTQTLFQTKQSPFIPNVTPWDASFQARLIQLNQVWNWGILRASSRL